MSKIKRPAFQFYPADYLGSQRVALMTLEEEGAYLRLLCYCWQHGSIPSNPEQIARLIGKGASTTLATNVATMFQPHTENDLILVHERLQQEIVKQNEWARKSADGGNKSAERRKNLKGGSTTLASVVEECLPNGVNQNATLLLQSASASSSSNTSSNKEVGADREKTYLLDDEFWTEMRRHYPDIEVEAESRKMDAWLLARPGIRKTRQFVINWLNKVKPTLAPAKVEEVEQW